MPTRIAVLVLCAGTIVRAAHAGPPADALEIGGRVVTVGGNELVLQTEAGELRLATDERTERPPELAAGDAVQVRYRSEVGRDVAERIVRVPGEPVPARQTPLSEEMAETGKWIGALTVGGILALLGLGAFALRRRARRASAAVPGRR